MAHPIDYLRSRLSYEPERGDLVWKTRPERNGHDRRFNREKAGKVAGHISPQGYVVITIEGRIYKAHRLAWLFVHGEWPAFEVDHKNRVRCDNRIDNLRPANRILNGANQSIARNNTSGVKGVYFEKRVQKWRARVRVNDKLIHLGTFTDLEDARRAYLAGAEKHFGEYATAGELAA